MEQMKAVTRRTYGGPDRLAFETVPVPEPAADEVLVRARAAALNMGDWHLMTGEPWLVRPTLGLRQPRSATFGGDVAGLVAAVGSDVTGFSVGDRVFGHSGHAFAELATLLTARAAHVPEGVTFETAAALPIAGVTALQAVREIGRVEEGHRVLVNGASGGVGHYAVQIARLLGASVTAVSSPRNHELLRGLGASEVIDHTTTDYTTLDTRYDVIIDVQGNHGGAANLRVLAPGGRWVLVGGPKDNRLLGPLPWASAGLLRAAFSSRHAHMFVAQETTSRLEQLAAWVVAGEVTPHVERTVPLPDLPEAMRHLGAGRTRGKQVVTVG
jgi:NADPH:quinone reductase-like Zn-dependent oxidoreductase